MLPPKETQHEWEVASRTICIYGILYVYMSTSARGDCSRDNEMLKPVQPYVVLDCGEALFRPHGERWRSIRLISIVVKQHGRRAGVANHPMRVLQYTWSFGFSSRTDLY